ncbi:hypothetical protein PQ610_07140 [Tardisphaera miroshnichenkoae]
MSESFDRILSRITDLPLYDVHNHLNPASLSAKGFDDVIFYHYIVSELGTAGVNMARLENLKGEQRLQWTKDSFKLIRNTSTFWCLKRIASEIYGVRTDSGDFLEELANAISASSVSAQTILRNKAKVSRSLLTLSPIEPIPPYDQFLFSGALRLDLLTTDVNQRSITALEDVLGREVKSARDLSEAIASLMNNFAGRLRAVTVNPQPEDPLDWNPGPEQVTPHVLSLRERGILKPESRNAIYAYSLRRIIEVAQRERLVVQVMIGVRRPIGGASPPDYALTAFDQNHLARLVSLFADYPDVKFDLFIADPLLNHASAVIAKNFPNVFLDGYWWYTMYPEYIGQFLRTRLQMLPYNKFGGFFSDAYVVDWVFGKAELAKRELARALSEQMEYGYIDEDTAVDIAEAVLHGNAETLYG